MPGGSTGPGGGVVPPQGGSPPLGPPFAPAPPAPCMPADPPAPGAPAPPPPPEPDAAEPPPQPASTRNAAPMTDPRRITRRLDFRLAPAQRQEPVPARGGAGRRRNRGATNVEHRLAPRLEAPNDGLVLLIAGRKLADADSAGARGAGTSRPARAAGSAGPRRAARAAGSWRGDATWARNEVLRTAGVEVVQIDNGGRERAGAGRLDRVRTRVHAEAIRPGGGRGAHPLGRSVQVDLDAAHRIAGRVRPPPVEGQRAGGAPAVRGGPAARRPGAVEVDDRAGGQIDVDHRRGEGASGERRLDG